MANYVSNKIICTKEILEDFFIDYYPFSTKEKYNKPYITFNKIVGVDSISDYEDKFGTSIYYGWGFTYNLVEDGLYEIKFATKWFYPIIAIIKSLEKFKNDIKWYAVEDNMIYVSKFTYNNNEICEEVLSLENEEFYKFDEQYHNSNSDNIDDFDNGEVCVWEYIKNKQLKWVRVENINLKDKYYEKYSGNY
ncbi:MAG: hypothetical protein PHN41_07455 [Bacteroidales bacterium]|nr:hypothetical protein [Bacteroidales bacterium]MDD3995777.1 hypothetical protein [Bacilli bacterium]